MVLGPLSGWAIRQWDRVSAGRYPPALQMLVANFSAGVLGAVLALLALVMVAPAVRAATSGLARAAEALMTADAVFKSSQGKRARDLLLHFKNVANQSKYIAYGPTHVDAIPHIAPDVLADLPTNPENMKTALTLDSRFWADHRDELQKRFNAWLAQ